jgi:hypothetical protein
MYWCKLRLKTAVTLVSGFALLTALPACKPEISNNGAFDLRGLLTKDAAKLNKLNPAVIKTVTHNGVSETKTVHIPDWAQELSLFIDADINKPSWKSNYKVNDEDSLLVYHAKDPDQKVQELIIKRNKQKVSWILIYTRTKNKLYYSAQRLTYFPDSLYRIDMSQRVRVIGTNNYNIQGIILRAKIQESGTKIKEK